MKVPGDYIAGLTDGEGCFSLVVRKDTRHERKSKATYFSWKAAFIISLRIDDKDLLDSVRETLTCGSVTFNSGSARFQVSNLDDLRDRIIPFFDHHKLYGKKAKDFAVWREAVDILIKYKIARGGVNVRKGTVGFVKVSWDKRDTDRLYQIRDYSSQFKSSRAVPVKWITRSLGRSTGDTD